MKTIQLLCFVAFTLKTIAQEIPKNVNVILVKGVSFKDVCNRLLDSGYSMQTKDNYLQTVRTEPKQYPKYWNAIYVVNVRVKDSVAFISGTITAPPQGGLLNNEPIFYQQIRKENHSPKAPSQLRLCG